MGASDIRERLRYRRTTDVHTYRRRDPTFPEPVAVIGGGPSYGILVWYWPEVAAWARRKGITPSPGSARTPQPPPESARSKQTDLVRMREELAELATLRERLGELSTLRERLDALEAGRTDDEEPG